MNTATLLRRALLVPPTILVIAALPPAMAGTPLLEPIRAYLASFSDGSFLTFVIAGIPRNYARIAPPYVVTTFAYATISLVAGLTAGTVAAVLLARTTPRTSVRVLSFLAGIPDFVLALLLQLMAVALGRLVGGRLFRIAMGSNDGLIVLPVVALAGYVALRVIHSGTATAGRLLNSDHVRFAAALGFPSLRVRSLHLTPGVIPVLRSELPVIIGNLVAALCIAERLFLIPGITRILFQFGFLVDSPVANDRYQYTLVVNALVTIFLISTVLFPLAHATLSILQRLAVSTGRSGVSGRSGAPPRPAVGTVGRRQ